MRDTSLRGGGKTLRLSTGKLQAKGSIPEDQSPSNQLAQDGLISEQGTLLRRN